MAFMVPPGSAVRARRVPAGPRRSTREETHRAGLDRARPAWEERSALLTGRLVQREAEAGHQTRVVLALEPRARRVVLAADLVDVDVREAIANRDHARERRGERVVRGARELEAGARALDVEGLRRVTERAAERHHVDRSIQ